MSRIEKISDLIKAVLLKAVELAGGETFTEVNLTKDPHEYSQVALKTYPYRTPKEERGKDKPLPFPSLVAYKMLNGRDSKDFGQVKIRLVGGIYNDTDDDSGEEDIERLENIVLRLAQNQSFEGWSLDGKIECKPIEEDGSQHHPKYFFFADLHFTRDELFEEEHYMR